MKDNVGISARRANKKSGRKALLRVECQKATSGTVRRARKAGLSRPRTDSRIPVPQAAFDALNQPLPKWLVTNTGTKKTLIVEAVNIEQAIKQALVLKLAKVESRLTVQPV